MNLKKRMALGVLISTLLAFSAYYAEYLPFTGKWIAAYRMDRYAQEQYPKSNVGTQSAGTGKLRQCKLPVAI